MIHTYLIFRFVSAGDDNSAIVWDVKLGRKLFTLSGHTLPITCACLLPPVYKYPDYCEGREERLLTGSSDRKICMWNASTGECILTLSQHKSAIKVRIAWIQILMPENMCTLQLKTRVNVRSYYTAITLRCHTAHSCDVTALRCRMKVKFILT